MSSPTSNLGRGFDALLRDIERWKERTSEASVGPGTNHDLYYPNFGAGSPRVTEVHTLILDTSATIINMARCKTGQMRLLTGGCSDITGRSEIIMVI
jgi:muramoyltetrapeptide carboxypeptidase LdcA involved in peptidoglycan recycling